MSEIKRERDDEMEIGEVERWGQRQVHVFDVEVRAFFFNSYDRFNLHRKRERERQTHRQETEVKLSPC